MLYLEFFFKKLLFRTYNLFIFVHTFQWTSSDFFFNFRLSSRNSQSQQTLAKKMIHFTIQFCSKNRTHFKELNLLGIEHNMLPQHSQTPFWIYKFSSKHVSIWCQEKYLHCTISWRPRTAFWKHLESIGLYISVYHRKRLNNFLEAARCLSLVKYFTIFHFNWNFRKLSYFSAFRYFHLLH